MTKAGQPPNDVQRLANNTQSNWLKDKGLRKLHLLIAFMFSTAAASGYSSSVINGLLILPQCTVSFYFLLE
jgi:hypothetical protein